MQVTLIGPLRTIAGAEASFEVDPRDVRNVRGLLAAVAERFPELAEFLEAGVAVAIDGVIYQDDVMAAIRPDSEVQILPQISGG